MSSLDQNELTLVVQAQRARHRKNVRANARVRSDRRFFHAFQVHTPEESFKRHHIFGKAPTEVQTNPKRTDISVLTTLIAKMASDLKV